MTDQTTAAMPDGFTEDITARARWARDRNQGYPKPAWSTGEQLAVALVLGNQDFLDAAGYTAREASQRLAGDLAGADVTEWLDDVRAALQPPEEHDGNG